LDFRDGIDSGPRRAADKKIGPPKRPDSELVIELRP